MRDTAAGDALRDSFWRDLAICAAAALALVAAAFWLALSMAANPPSY